jgi:hypothetical protein
MKSKSTDSMKKYFCLFEDKDQAVEFEHNVLSCGSEFLPSCALEVVNGAVGTEEYWSFLIDQYYASVDLIYISLFEDPAVV